MIHLTIKGVKILLTQKALLLRINQELIDIKDNNPNNHINQEIHLQITQINLLLLTKINLCKRDMDNLKDNSLNFNNNSRINQVNMVDNNRRMIN